MPIIILTTSEQVMVFSLLHLVSPKLIKFENALIWERNLPNMLHELKFTNQYQSSWAKNKEAGRHHPHSIKQLYFSDTILSSPFKSENDLTINDVEGTNFI